MKKSKITIGLELMKLLGLKEKSEKKVQTEIARECALSFLHTEFPNQNVFAQCFTTGFLEGAIWAGEKLAKAKKGA